jgi:hypothetical protein
LNPLEKLEQQIYDEGITLIERRPSPQADAMYLHVNGRAPCIYIDPAITSQRTRYVLLAEELAHHRTTVGDILPEATPDQCRQERIAREYAFRHTAPYAVILQMLRERYYPWEIAEWLFVPLWYLMDAIEFYSIDFLMESDEFETA